MARTLLALSDAHESDPAYAEEAAACLEQWVQEDSHQGLSIGMDAWESAKLMKVLNAHSEHLGGGRVVRIEWLLHPLLSHDPEFNAPNLYRELARDPGFFVWLVELAYKPANASHDEQPQSSEAQRRMALSAYTVLSSWPEGCLAPGVDDNGQVDSDLLSDWVDRARERLVEIDRGDAGDMNIGRALAASPADPDGTWPGRAVSDLIERLASVKIERGFYVAVRNRRGVTSRTLTAGGGQERELARYYHSQKQRLDQWPRTADIFAALAQSYESDAEQEDEEAEAHRRGLPV